MNKFTVSMARAGVFAFCITAASLSATAQSTAAPGAEATPPPPSLLDMPLVGVDEGQRFQQGRSVQASSVSMKQILPAQRPAASGPSLANVTGEALNQPEAEPMLGHPLPTSTKTPLGFPRADFATDKRAAATRASSANEPSKSALSNTVIK